MSPGSLSTDDSGEQTPDPEKGSTPPATTGRGRSTTIHRTGSPNARSQSITFAEGNDTQGVRTHSYLIFAPQHKLSSREPCLPALR